MDFEGTDGLERGEDQLLERKLALLAFACIDIIIINMWSQEVGRFHASNMSLLRTVFEVNLKLFNASTNKPVLLFALRDWSNDISEHTLFETLNRNINQIWSSVQSSANIQDTPISHFFKIEFQALPHYVFQKEQFLESVSTLRSRIVDGTSANYVFDNDRACCEIPLNGLASYLNSCWDSITTCSDVNIPTQRELLAEVKSAEACNTYIEDYKNWLVQYYSILDRKENIPNLIEELYTKQKSLLKSFDSQLSLYKCSVISRARVKPSQNH